MELDEHADPHMGALLDHLDIPAEDAPLVAEDTGREVPLDGRLLEVGIANVVGAFLQHELGCDLPILAEEVGGTQTCMEGSVLVALDTWEARTYSDGTLDTNSSDRQ